MEKLPGQLGFLVLTEDGSVLNSGGELENDEATAKIIYNLVTRVNIRNLMANGSSTTFHRMMVQFPTNVYSIALSNKKLHVVKRKYVPNEPVNV